jgi:TolB-like protein
MLFGWMLCICLFTAGLTAAEKAKKAEPPKPAAAAPAQPAPVAAPAPAPAPEPPQEETPAAAPTEARKLLVDKIEGVDVDEAFAKSIEEALVLDIGKREGFSVVTSAEMTATVQHAQTSVELGCADSAECVIEVQKKLAVDTLVAGKIAKMGDEYILSLNTVDVNNSIVGKRTNVQGADLNDIKGKIKEAVDKLLGFAKEKPMFTLKEGETLKLAVMPLSARGVEIATADALTSILSSQLNQIKGISVISQDDIKAMLAKVSMDSAVECTDSMQCVVEIGASLGLSKLVTGSVGKVKDTFVISIQLIDTRRAEVENRVLESFAGDAEELKNAVKLAAYQLAGIDYTSKPGSIAITFNVADGDLQFGPTKGKLEKSQFAAENLVPGRYNLRVMADQDDYFPYQTDIYVAPGTANVRNLTVLERPTPWYKTWWFWTVTGVVIAGAATATGVVLGLKKTELGTGTVKIETGN